MCQPVARLGQSFQSFPREIMFDAVKVDLSAAANRAAHAKAGGVVVQDADGGDEGRKGGGATSGAHSSLQRRQMLEKQSHLVRKVNVQRMMAHAGVGTLWQIAGAFLVVILFSFFLTSGKASGGRRGWDNAASLPYNTLDDGEIGAAWTTQRLCKHFGAPTPSRVRFLFGVDSPKMLQSSVKAWRRVDVIQVNVGFRLHTDMPPAEAHGWRHRAKGAFDKVTGRSTIGSPAIVADASPYTARTSAFTLYDFLNMFYQQVLDSHQPVGREQGLMVTFVDPRAIEPSLRLIQLATRLGRLPGPAHRGRRDFARPRWILGSVRERVRRAPEPRRNALARRTRPPPVRSAGARRRRRRVARVEARKNVRLRPAVRLRGQNKKVRARKYSVAQMVRARRVRGRRGRVSGARGVREVVPGRALRLGLGGGGAGGFGALGVVGGGGAHVRLRRERR
jgi:hypothetical protein